MENILAILIFIGFIFIFISLCYAMLSTKINIDLNKEDSAFLKWKSGRKKLEKFDDDEVASIMNIRYLEAEKNGTYEKHGNATGIKFDFNGLNQTARLACLRKTPKLIRYLDFPSPDEQLVAIEHSTTSMILKHINVPCNEAKIAAVKKDSSAIKLIEHPTQEMLLWAILKKLQ